MPIGSILGGIISGNGAAGAGQSAARNFGNLATSNRNLESGYVDAGNNALGALTGLAGLGGLRWNGSSYQTDTNNKAGQQAGYTEAFKASPGYAFVAPYLATYGDQVGNYGKFVDDAYDKLGLRNGFETSPGYQFRLDQGRNALANSGAARGMSLSGAQAKALTDYNQGAASQEYGNWVNNYQNWLNQYANYTGAYGKYSDDAIGTVSNAYGNYVNQLANIAGLGQQGTQASITGQTQPMTAGFNALASGQAQQANALGTGISSGLSNLASLATAGLTGGLFGGGATTGGGVYGNTSITGSTVPDYLIADYAHANPLAAYR